MTELIFKEEAYRIIGACMEVHRELGSGFLEPVYQEALSIELTSRDILHEREKPLTVTYKGTALEKSYFADFLCHNKIIVELKALNSLSGEHEAQILNYLKATGLRLGLLVNFGTDQLEWKRIVR